MKRLLIFTIFLCGSMVLSAQEKKAAANQLKSVTVYEQKYDNGIAGKAMVESVTRYDQAGNVIEEIEYKQGKITKHTTNKFDVANNKIEETELDANGKKVKVSVYTYNKNLRTEKVVYDAGNKIIMKKTYKYETYQ
jgi:hypothetical protein